MRQKVAGLLMQIRDEYLSGQRASDAEVVEETIDMVHRVEKQHQSRQGVERS